MLQFKFIMVSWYIICILDLYKALMTLSYVHIYVLARARGCVFVTLIFIEYIKLC